MTFAENCEFINMFKPIEEGISLIEERFEPSKRYPGRKFNAILRLTEL